MKKRTIIALTIFIVIIIAVIVLAIYQRNNISAIITTVSKTEEEIAVELDNSKKQLAEELEDKYSTMVDDLTADEEKKIMNGELSVEEAVESINKKYEAKKTQNTNTNNNNSSSKVDELIGDKVIELYSLKAYYLGQLGQMEATVKREYSALPKEKKNLLGVKEIANKYMGTAMSLLNQCDSQVNELISQLEKELKSLNADTSIFKTIRDTYEKEKALKKAYYLKKLEG